MEFKVVARALYGKYAIADRAGQLNFSEVENSGKVEIAFVSRNEFSKKKKVIWRKNFLSNCLNILFSKKHLMNRKFFAVFFLFSILVSHQSFAQNSFVQNESKIVLTLPDLKTEVAARVVEKTLARYHGKIISATADMLTSKVEVHYDADNISAEDIMQVLWQAGYGSFYVDAEGKKFEMTDRPEIKMTYVKVE